MSIKELVAKYTNENKNMVEMHFKRQLESLPSTLKVNKEEEKLSYNEEEKNNKASLMLSFKGHYSHILLFFQSVS